MTNQFINNPIILIDNDELIRIIWRFAAQEKQINIHTFSSYQAFNKVISDYSKSTTIYIDSDLAESIKGETYARILFDQGFTDINLCTGYDKTLFPPMPWIKSIIGKEPPFLLNVF